MMYNLLLNKKKWDAKREAAANIIKHLFMLNREEKREEQNLINHLDTSRRMRVVLDYQKN